jgi:hypothetical protein
MKSQAPDLTVQFIQKVYAENVLRQALLIGARRESLFDVAAPRISTNLMGTLSVQQFVALASARSICTPC